MSLKVAWSLLSLLTWFRSRYQQFTGDNKFWSFLRSEKKKKNGITINFEAVQAAEGSHQGPRGATTDGDCRSSSYSGCCSERATQQTAEEPSTLWWRKASNSLDSEGKNWTKNTNQNPHSWHGPLDPNIHNHRQAFSFKHPIVKKVVIFT